MMMMRSEVSPLSSSPAPLPRFSPEVRKSAASFGSCQKKSVCFSVKAASDHRSRPPVRTVGCPEPPWLVLPPSPPENPFSGKAWPSDLQMKSVGGTEIPLSIRMVQMKKRLAGAAPIWTNLVQVAEGDAPPGAVEVPLGKAISALVFMIGELQRSVMDGAVDEAVLDRVSRDRRDSFVWLFRRVFFNSPDLVVTLLILLARYVSFSAQKASHVAAATPITEAIADEKSEIVAACAALNEELSAEHHLQARAAESAPEPNRIREYLNWFDIGVKEGNLDPVQHEDEESCTDRRRRVYERTIAEGGVNSMILSNYAQFLYRIANDHDR